MDEMINGIMSKYNLCEAARKDLEELYSQGAIDTYNHLSHCVTLRIGDITSDFSNHFDKIFKRG